MIIINSINNGMGENVRVRLENIRKMCFEKFGFVRVRNYITAIWVFDW